MTEIRGPKIARCQHCGRPLRDHPAEKCEERVNLGSYDMSHNTLSEVDRLAGALLKEIMRYKSIESIANSAYGQEFFDLLDYRRHL